MRRMLWAVTIAMTPPFGHRDGMEILFERQADSLDAAIASAVADVERAGFPITRVELEREAISA